MEVNMEASCMEMTWKLLPWRWLKLLPCRVQVMEAPTKAADPYTDVVRACFHGKGWRQAPTNFPQEKRKKGDKPPRLKSSTRC